MAVAKAMRALVQRLSPLYHRGITSKSAPGFSYNEESILSSYIANFKVIPRWRHSVSVLSNSKSVPLNHCNCMDKFSHNVVSKRAFTTHQCLHREQTPESDIDYIEKELEVEKNFSRKQKRAASDPRNSMVNVGRFVPHKILELRDENGISLGSINRNQAVALSQEKKLKLVLLNPAAKPWPTYKLMTGQELHREQLKRNQQVKKKKAPTQLKEIKASWNIGQHDIDVRRRQLENWFLDHNSNIHARVTVTGGKGNAVIPQEKQMEVVKQLMVGLEDRLALNGPPKMTGRNQGTLTVTIRTMSGKEKAAYTKSLAEKTPPEK